MIRSFVSSTSPTKVKYITTALLLIVTTVPYDVICLDRGWHHAYLMPSCLFFCLLLLLLSRSASNNGPLQRWNDQTDHGLRPCHDSEATTTNDGGALGIHKITSGTIWHLFSLLHLVFPAVFLSPEGLVQTRRNRSLDDATRRYLDDDYIHRRWSSTATSARATSMDGNESYLNMLR